MSILHLCKDALKIVNFYQIFYQKVIPELFAQESQL
jgi:hypothetical protein